MVSLVKSKQREAIRKHYYANRDYYKRKAYKKRALLREWVCELKKNTPCTDCNKLFPPYVTDFDHIEAMGKKLGTISSLANSGSFKNVCEEIAISELVCANCHRIRTFERSNGLNKV